MVVDMDAVGDLIRDVAEQIVMPRHRALGRDDIDEKSPGEVVTVVDNEAESALSAGLRRLLPGVPVVGEEAASADASLLSLLPEAPLVWLVDPLDGTSNFIAGSTDFAVMVALVHSGETVAAWIHQPAREHLYVAERGAGAFVDGVRLRRQPAPAEPNLLRGSALTRFLSPAQKQSVAAAVAGMHEVDAGHTCAGVDYPLVAEGDRDFVLFWRTLAWDHAPGALVVRESGGVVAHLDGVPYTPARQREGLLVAADRATHTRVAQLVGL